MVANSAIIASSWARALVQISPYTFAAIGIALSIGVSVLDTAWGVYITRNSLIGAAIKTPRITSKNLIRICVGIIGSSCALSDAQKSKLYALRKNSSDRDFW
ncbi:hypothetical protein RND81_08G081900 [Saponaria officinalis]|uniref:V-ATPase proteolipid subunit C-like domain-containing protein n=1 Tax=Saponaria officinalis TaxID=3572 RepID=A0AAW1J5Q7_SAPOF